MKEAVKRAVQKITAWSYSRFSDYQKCPALAKYKHVEKRREPDNPAMAKGSRIHALAEQYTGGRLKTLPAELDKFRKEFLALRQQKALCEQEWAFDEQWNKVDWFAPNAWLRVKMDAHYIVQTGKATRRVTEVHVIDHKTGRQYPDHALQRSLYALGAFLVYPDAYVVVAKHWYLDSGEEAAQTFSIEDLPRLKKEWLKNITAMMNDTRFAPRPGDYCRFCHFRKANGGPCKF